MHQLNIGEGKFECLDADLSLKWCCPYGMDSQSPNYGWPLGRLAHLNNFSLEQTTFLTLNREVAFQ